MGSSNIPLVEQATSQSPTEKPTVTRATSPIGAYMATRATSTEFPIDPSVVSSSTSVHSLNLNINNGCGNGCPDSVRRNDDIRGEDVLPPRDFC